MNKMNLSKSICKLLDSMRQSVKNNVQTPLNAIRLCKQ